jgi:uncharacterized protein YecT (DUF1311 family)
MNKTLLFLTVCLLILSCKNKQKIDCEKHDSFQYYYGLGVKKDYKNAYICAESQSSSSYIVLLSLMYVNGDFIKQDYYKARAILENYMKRYHHDDYTFRTLLSEIKKRTQNKYYKKKRIEFWDIASTITDLTIASNILYQLKSIEVKNEIKKMKSSLKANQSVLLDSVEFYEKKSTLYFSEVINCLYKDGTGRPQILNDVKIKSMSDFSIALKSTYPDKSLNVSNRRFFNADFRLNSNYSRLIQQFKEDYEITNTNIELDKILFNLKQSQRFWIKYRDFFSLLIDERYNNIIAALNLKTLLSDQRSLQFLMLEVN